MKKLIPLTLAVLLSIAAPFTAFAAGEDSAEAAWDGEPVTIYAAVAVAGEFAEDADGKLITGSAVEVTDEDGDGTLTLNDAFMAIHAALCPDGVGAYSSYEGDYGLSVAKLWGDESGAFGYYINNVSATSARDLIADGDAVAAFIYSDTANYSDMYAWFENSEITAAAGEAVTLALKAYAYDESWNQIEIDCDSAAVSVLAEDGSETDISGAVENGSVTLTFEEAGTYTVIAKTADTVIVPAYCTVIVEDAADLSDTSSESSESVSSEGADSSAADQSEAEAEQPEAETEQTVGGDIPVYVWVIIGAAVFVVLFVIFRKKK